MLGSRRKLVRAPDSGARLRGAPPGKRNHVRSSASISRRCLLAALRSPADPNAERRPFAGGTELIDLALRGTLVPRSEMVQLMGRLGLAAGRSAVFAADRQG
jgi:hypothetical protein